MPRQDGLACCLVACSAASGYSGSSGFRFLGSRSGHYSRTNTRAAPSGSPFGAFAATLVAFFLAEIGDKTQIATIGLAARFGQFYPVVIGTTLGMMLANIPVVAIGDRIAGRLPVKAIRLVAAAVFALLGVLTVAGIGE